MNITPAELDAFTKDFNLAVEWLQEKYDVTISLGSITYTENQFTSKMTVDNSRDPESIERANFDMNVWRYAHLGLAKGMYNRVFIGADGQKYALWGFNTKAPKYPLFVLRISTGERIRVSERFIKEFLDEYYVKNHNS